MTLIKTRSSGFAVPIDELYEAFSGVVIKLSPQGDILCYKSGNLASPLLTKQPWPGRNIHELLPEERWNTFQHAAGQVKEGEGNISFEFPLLQEDEVFWF